MEIGTQIKKYRSESGMSQEELAEKVFVSRQTISNWETEKNYPDVHSLVLISQIFQISLDQLIKGDIETMKREINELDVKEFKRAGVILFIMEIIMIVAAVPLAVIFGWLGLAGWGVWAAITLIYGYYVERLKKKNSIQTYKEIVSFMEGTALSEEEVKQEQVKLPYQRILGPVLAALVAIVICTIMGGIMLLIHII